MKKTQSMNWVSHNLSSSRTIEKLDFDSYKNNQNNYIYENLYNYILLARLKSGYSFIWDAREIWDRVVDCPWHFYDN